MSDAEPGTVSWRQLYRETIDRLAGADVDARRIVEEASGHEGSAFHLGLDELATARGVAALDRMVAARLEGRPLQYVLGRWGYRSLDLMVDERVLIPRPETEQIVDVAHRELDRIGGSGPHRVADLGTGSGAIGLAILTERLSAEVWLTDASPAAIEVARANLVAVGRAAARATISTGSWYGALADEDRHRFDLIVSNPPYVADDELLPAVVADWEPREALRAGPRGLDDLQILFAGAPAWLAARGALVVEFGETQAADVRQIARAAGFADLEIITDHNDRDRIAVARRTT